MTRTLKSGETIKIEKQFRNQSNNYTNDDSKIYADLYKVKFNNGRVGIVCATELEDNGK